MKKWALFILTADMHLALNMPASRKDNFSESLLKKLKHLQEFQEQLQIPILDAGDIFNHPTKSIELVNHIFDTFPDLVYTIPGNHDMVNHNILQYNKTCFALAEKANLINNYDDNTYITEDAVVYFFRYGAELKNAKENNDLIKIAVTHQMVLQKPNSIIPGTTAKELLKKHNYDVIVSGHNHESFVVEHDGKILINPGCMMRTKISEKDYEPSFYILYSDLSWERKYYPFEKGIFKEEEHQEQKERDERIEAFVAGIKDFDISIDFRENIDNYFDKNNTRESVKNIIMEVVNEYTNF